MSQREDLLIEIGCEEIPARMLPRAAAQLSELVCGLLEKAGLAHDPPREFWTSRRLAVLVPATQTSTAAAEQTLLGPPARAAWDGEGNPTRAAEGFARKHGLSAGDLRRVETDKGEYAAAVVELPAQGVGAVLARGFEAGVSRIRFAKTMRWSGGEHVFVRPVHWLVALAGSELLDLSLFGVRSGRMTEGHRAVGPRRIEIASAGEWAAELERAGLQPDPARRREELRERLERAAREAGGTLKEDEELLAEVADMVELPSALAGACASKFVERLPAEILGTCLKHHQKAFTVVDANGGTLPAFAVAINMPRDPQGHVRRGHEWVIGGRLDDALFFWTEDRRRTLESRRAELEGVVFQQELGTFAAKALRVERLAGWLAERTGLDGPQSESLSRAARLARCDLVTGLVGEFPELQGQVGGLLAREDGEQEETWQAIYDLYRPSGAADGLPSGPVGTLLGLADRLDTLAGGLAVGLMPSGSRDPFALRRAGTAAVRLGAEVSGLDLFDAAREAFRGYSGGERGPDLSSRADATLPLLRDFLLERFGAQAERRGARYDEIAAVRALAPARGLVVADLQRRLEALEAFRASEDFRNLAAAAKRVRNILQQAADRGDEIPAPGGGPVEGEAAEVELAAAAERLGAELAELEQRGLYGQGLAQLAGLRPVVDRFFDEIMVMVDDRTVRSRRLAILRALDQLSRRIVDISELVVDGR